jgi:hypothetical protein
MIADDGFHQAREPDGRLALYVFGAAEALVLDAAYPDWQRRYSSEKAYLERYYE